VFVPRQHKTLQGAIDAAASGDTLWVAPGVYSGTLTIKGKKVVLFGDEGPEKTTLDGRDSVRVLHVEDVNGGGILGFTIRGGRAPAGGGVYCLRDTNFTVSSCILKENWESGLQAWRCSGIVLSSSTIQSNRGSGVVLENSSAFIFQNRFLDNTGNFGGGLSLVSSQLLYPVKECLFQRNRAEGSMGGGVAADSSFVQLGSCSFIENRSTVAGGAVAAAESSKVSVSQCLFQANDAPQSGALHADHSSLDVYRSLFDKNHAGVAGAAIGILGRQFANVNPTVAQCTFYKNTSDQTGASLYLQEVSAEIRKNIFVVEGANKAVFAPGSYPRFECNLLYDPSGAPIGPLPSADTLVGDPLFCDPDKGDFKLRDLSPAYLAPCGPVGALGKGCASFKILPTH
jgi:predicted outer membrane repeat protein